MAISLYKPEDGGVNFEPQNKLTAAPLFIDVKEDMASQVQEQKKLNEEAMDKAVLDNLQTLN